MSMSLNKVKKLIEDNEVAAIDLKYADLVGNWYHLTFPVSRLEGVLKNGIPFDGSSVPGMRSVESGDMLLLPDLSTAILDPFSAAPTLRVLAFICDAYHEEEVEGEKRVVLRLHPRLAPVKVGVFPLVKKDGMPEIARRIEDDLRRSLTVFYGESGGIGRRYRRQDEAGTPFCVTVDGQTVEDGTVTVRDRDTMEQVRLPAEQLRAHLLDRLEQAGS